MINLTQAPASAQAPIQPSLFAPTRLPDPTSEQIAAMLAAHTVALDVEVETDPAKGTALGYPAVPSRDYGLSYSAPISYLALAWFDVTSTPQHMVFQAPFSEMALNVISQLCEQDTHTLVGHNIVYDVRALAKHFQNFAVSQCWCTSTLARLLTPELSSFDLLTVAYDAGITIPDFIRNMKKKRSNLSYESAEDVQNYVAWDALAALGIYSAQGNSIDDEDTYQLVQWEVQAVAEFCRMAAKGLKLNLPYVQERIQHLITERQRLWRLLVDDGCSNPGSTQKRAEYIYNTKKIPLPVYKPLSPLFTEGGAKRAADGQPVTIKDMSTGEAALTAIIEENPEAATVLKLLIDFLHVEKMVGTLEALVDHAAVDGHVHTMLNIATTTGRRSSSNPNLQNLTFGAQPDDIAGDMAGVFIGDDGYTLVEIDLNGAENWASAMIAGDDAMAAACASSDFHSSMAAGYFGERWEQADKDERKRLRRMGKSITFGTAYGMGRKKLALTLGITEQEAQGILDAKNRVFWATAEAKQAAQTKAETVGYINLWSGRQVPVDPDQSYTAWDYLAQGAVAELVKRAIVLIMGLYRERKMKSYIASEVHDSLILAVHHSEWDQAIFIAKMMMESVIPDDLNNRTTPPIQWIAEPDFEGNAKKWGRNQWHPEPKQEAITQWFADEEGNFWGMSEEEVAALILRPEYGPFESEAEAKAFCGQLVQIPTLPPEPVSQDIPEIVFRVPSLNFEWRGKVRLDPTIRFSQWSPAERVEATRFFIDYIQHIHGMLQQVYEVYLPAKLPDGTVGLAPTPTGVNMENWAKIPALWLRVAEQGIDVESILELSKDDLLALHNERQAQVTSIQRLQDTLLEYLAKFPSEHHYQTVEEVEV